MRCLKTAVRRLSLSLGAEASHYKGLLEIPSFHLHCSLPSVWAELISATKIPELPSWLEGKCVVSWCCKSIQGIEVDRALLGRVAIGTP